MLKTPFVAMISVVGNKQYKAFIILVKHFPINLVKDSLMGWLCGFKKRIINILAAFQKRKKIIKSTNFVLQSIDS